MHTQKIKNLYTWLIEGKYVFIALAVCIVALTICICTENERCIRLTGLFLQILGIATVAWGIHETRKFFGHEPITKKLKNWLIRFPLFKKHTVLTMSGTASISLGASATAYGTHGAGINASLEERVEALEKNINSIHERITSTKIEADKKHDQLKTSLSEETSTRSAEVGRTQKMLEDTATGGIHISAIGACWLFVGVILSTASQELALWLQ